MHKAFCEGPVFLTRPADQKQQQQQEHQQQQEGTNPPEQQEPGTSRAPAPPASSSPTASPTTTTSAAPSTPEPYVRIVFIGTGFLMHQIRRMVGLALAVARKAAPPECIRAALDPGKRGLAVPTAPPNGLMMVSGGSMILHYECCQY